MHFFFQTSLELSQAVGQLPLIEVFPSHPTTDLELSSGRWSCRDSMVVIPKPLKYISCINFYCVLHCILAPPPCAKVIATSNPEFSFRDCASLVRVLDCCYEWTSEDSWLVVHLDDYRFYGWNVVPSKIPCAQFAPYHNLQGLFNGFNAWHLSLYSNFDQIRHTSRSGVWSAIKAD